MAPEQKGEVEPVGLHCRFDLSAFLALRDFYEGSERDVRTFALVYILMVARDMELLDKGKLDFVRELLVSRTGRGFLSHNLFLDQFMCV
jgi:hypothetical protein